MDLMVWSWSGHGMTGPNVSGNEPGEQNQGLVAYDGIWWDYQVWDFICTLRPCRLLMPTDTCFAESNWRKAGRVMTFNFFFKKRDARFKLDVRRLSKRKEWAGQIIQMAGSLKTTSAMGDDNIGGTWTYNLFEKTLSVATSNTNWYDRAAALMPLDQPVAFSTYNASPEFINAVPLK
jgi:hypothetical protein